MEWLDNSQHDTNRYEDERDGYWYQVLPERPTPEKGFSLLPGGRPIARQTATGLHLDQSSLLFIACSANHSRPDTEAVWFATLSVRRQQGTVCLQGIHRVFRARRRWWALNHVFSARCLLGCRAVSSTLPKPWAGHTRHSQPRQCGAPTGGRRSRLARSGQRTGLPPSPGPMAVQSRTAGTAV